MKRPQLIAPGSLNRMLQEANEAWGRCDYQQSFELLERASRLDPANTRILMQLGQSYGRRYDYAAAERCFDKAVRVATRKAEALATAGQLCADFASHQLAERYYRQALTQKDAPPETFVRLAELCERLRRTEEAAGLVERALHLDANCALARLTQARLSRQAGHLEEAEKILRPVLGSAQREMRVRGYYELGAILDRQRRYDEAMTALLEAKKSLAARCPATSGRDESRPGPCGPDAGHPLCRYPAALVRTEHRSSSRHSGSPYCAAIPVPARPCSNKCSTRILKFAPRKKPRFFRLTPIVCWDVICLRMRPC